MKTKTDGRDTRPRGMARAASAAVAVLLGLTACVGGASTSSGQDEPQALPDDGAISGEVEWWTTNLQMNFGDYIQGMIDTFEDENPEVTIRWVDVPGQEVTSKLLAAIASGQVPDAVNYLSTTHGLFRDSMTDLSPYYSDDEMDVYLDSLRENLTNSENQQVAIPWYNGGTNVAAYRLSIVEPLGFDPANPPTTWEEALELAQAVQDETGMYGTTAMAYSDVVQSEGVDLLSDDGTEVLFNTEEARDILETFKEYYDSGAIAPGVLGKDHRAYEQNLANGQIAFDASLMPTLIADIVENSPDIAADLFIAPAVTGASGENLMPNQQVFGIPELSRNKPAAAEWLKFVTSPENQLEFGRLAAIYPSTSATLEDPFYAEAEVSTPIDQARQVLVDTFDTATDSTLGSPNDQYLRELFDEEVRAYMSGSKSAEEALDAAEAAWVAELAKGE